MSETLSILVFRDWMASGERGLSSESIVEHLTGFSVRHHRMFGIDHPHDPSDFRRCERLLREVPLARAAFDEMRTASPTWALFVDAWDELVYLAEEEMPGAIDDPHPRGSAPRLHARIQSILAEASR